MPVIKCNLAALLSVLRRAASEERTTWKRTESVEGEAESRATGSVLASTWNSSREGRTGAAAAVRQSSGTCPHTCTLAIATALTAMARRLTTSLPQEQGW